MMWTRTIPTANRPLVLPPRAHTVGGRTKITSHSVRIPCPFKWAAFHPSTSWTESRICHWRGDWAPHFNWEVFALNSIQAHLIKGRWRLDSIQAQVPSHLKGNGVRTEWEDLQNLSLAWRLNSQVRLTSDAVVHRASCTWAAPGLRRWSSCSSASRSACTPSRGSRTRTCPARTWRTGLRRSGPAAPSPRKSRDLRRVPLVDENIGRDFMSPWMIGGEVHVGDVISLINICDVSKSNRLKPTNLV
jgi:hypothetical protein